MAFPSLSRKTAGKSFPLSAGGNPVILFDAIRVTDDCGDLSLSLQYGNRASNFGVLLKETSPILQAHEDLNSALTLHCADTRRHKRNPWMCKSSPLLPSYHKSTPRKLLGANCQYIQKEAQSTDQSVKL